MFTLKNRPPMLVAILMLMMSVSGCGPLFDNGTRGATGTDKDVLRLLNADHNGNKTIRFETMPIKVYIQNVSDGKDQVNRWVDATDGFIQFEFLDSEPEQGIVIRYGISNPIACGVTYEPEWSNGVIKKGNIEIDPKTILPSLPLGGCKQTVAHEVGHALGLLGHTADGGLMDPDGGNGEITPQVKRVMKTLYTLPPNTDNNAIP